MATGIPALVLKGSLKDVPTENQLNDAAARLNIALPPSYREFAMRYGNGLTCGLFMIYVPMERTGFAWSSSVVDMSNDLKRDIKEAAEGKFLNYKPDGSPELARRLVPFGGSENGDILAWDPASPSSNDGELWIYVVGPRSDSIARSAPDLVDFIRRCSLPNTGDVLRRAEFTLPPTFEPRPGRGQ